MRESEHCCSGGHWLRVNFGLAILLFPLILQRYQILCPFFHIRQLQVDFASKLSKPVGTFCKGVVFQLVENGGFESSRDIGEAGADGGEGRGG